VSTDGLQRVAGLREPQRLSHQLSTLLAAEIVSGRLAVGAAFPSSEEIVTRFGVSRTVAREMVQALAMLGLVNIQHGKRTEVCPAEDWDILSFVVQEALRREGKAEPLLRDLYEFRLLIEPQAAAWMAEYGRPGDVAELAQLADSMERLAAMEVPVVEVLNADRRFHDLVARASDNRVVAAVSRDIREVIGTLWGFSTLDPADARQVAEQHQRIAAAVQLHDARAAAAAMRDHLVWAAQADLHGLGEPAAELRFAASAATE
jgi:DNA-binding FadR family transcriptional regulator